MKNKKREEWMQTQYQDSTVVVEIVQIIIQIDNSGSQMKRYGMSQLMANTGKGKTTTCQSKYFPLGCQECRIT